MAMCSYQTIARYDDSSRKLRARTLDDIRSKQRLDLERTRFRSKNLKMIQNRSRSLFEDLLSSESESDYAPTSPAMDEPDCIPYQGGSQMKHETPSSQRLSASAEAAEGWGTQQSGCWDIGQHCNEFQDTPASWPSPAPSPAWSSSASSSSATSAAVTQALMTDLLPSCLFEIPEEVRGKPKSPSAAGSSSDYQDENKLIRQLSYKQCNKRSSSRSKSIRDIERIRSQLLNLRNSLNMFDRDAAATSQVIRNHWQVILDAIQMFDKDIVTETLNILITITGNNLILPDTILHMLQHGLIFNLADTIGRTAEGPVPAVRLLHNIARSTPNAIPYMIDFVHRSKLLKDFADFINTGYNSEAQTIIEFYYLITETTMHHIYQKSPFQPLIPEILLLTGVSKDTIESFGPVATLTKCLSPTLLRNSISKCTARTNLINVDLIDMTFRILAHALKLIHILSISDEELPKHTEWILKTLCCFRDSQIETHLTTMARGLERTIQSSESSEHCSQGVGTDSLATASLDKCRQFISFYQQYYGGLSNHFAHLMIKMEPTSPAKINSWCI